MKNLKDDIRDGLSGLSDAVRRLRGGSDDPLTTALVAFGHAEADDLVLLQQLFGVLRPHRGESAEEAVERFNRMVGILREDPALAASFRRHFVGFFTHRRMIGFFADSGILPATGFFSEWSRMLVHRVLPAVPDERDVKDCLHVFLTHPDDWQWLATISQESMMRFWQLQAPADEMETQDWQQLIHELLDAIRLLAHRISGLGMDSALLNASTHLENFAPSFLELPSEAHHYYQSLHAHFADPSVLPDDGRHLLVLVAQCLDGLQRARRYFLSAGTSLHMTYLLTRCQQSLERLAELVTMMNTFLQSPAVTEALLEEGGAAASIVTPGSRLVSEETRALKAWAQFVHRSLVAENRRNNFGDYWQRLSELLALRVAENAAQSGEHYLCTNRREYGAMWLSAMGAGVFIGVMALLKVFAGELHASLFMTAVMYSLIYGLGFTVIYLLGFTVATKQPAMTAQTLVGQLSSINSERPDDLTPVVDLIAAVCRSQLAAIAGNILVAFPVAILLGMGLGQWLGESPVSADKAAHLLHDLDIFGWAIPHAALAGVFLYLAGLISGYFDNRAAHNQVGPRIARLPWLQQLLGRQRAHRFGQYIGNHLGGMMGNFLFGCMLGSAGIFGVILGLPVDIRHIAFSSANLGYVLIGSDVMPAWQTLAWAVLGVLCIGLTNLLVSFMLALRTAFRARRLQFSGARVLARAVWQRFREAPGSFFIPPKQTESS
jgi:site-specific recombinase